MTCIIALEYGGKVYMGGDSAASDDDWHLRALANPKVFRLENMLIGCSGYTRMQQLIQYNLKVPKSEYSDDPMRYLVIQFVPALRNCLKDGGFIKIENNEEESKSLLLVGLQGNAYIIETNFQITKINTPFTTIGIGSPYVMGAMAVLYPIITIVNPDVEKVIIHILEIVGTLVNGVCEPYYVFSI